MGRMRLVLATPLYPPDPGGPATYAKVLEEELPKRGWQVDLVKFGDVRALPKVRRHFAYFMRAIAPPRMPMPCSRSTRSRLAFLPRSPRSCAVSLFS